MWRLVILMYLTQRPYRPSTVPRKIVGTLEYELPILLEKEMREEKITVETKVNVTSFIQDEYFAAKTKELKAQQEVKNRRSSLKRNLTRRCSSSLSVDSDVSQKQAVITAQGGFGTSQVQ